MSLIATTLWGQQYGGNSPALKWRQIKTDSISIIYPEGKSLDSAAQKIARIINQLQQKGLYNLGDRLEPVPIVLRPTTTNTNGYVGLGPYRSEFFLASPMDVMGLGSQDWATTLALHEYRHALQYNNINRGLTRTLDFILGDNARSLFSDMAVPNWFFEGDAVFNETRLSWQGRGRLPRFMNSYSVLFKDQKKYNYQQLRNGSYKNNIPNHYSLGYLLVSYGYKQYGPDFWRKVIADAARYKGVFYPFQKAIKRVSGVSFKQFRSAAFKAYRQRYVDLPWIKLNGRFFKRGAIKVSPLTESSNNEVIDYQYPYPLKRNSEIGIIALKTNRKKLSHFVYLDSIKEVNLGEAPITRDPYFGYNKDHIIYTRHKADPRWRYKEYSDLEVLDIKIHKRKKITKRQRYFTPDISISGNLIAASELKENGRSAIVILNNNGQLLAKFIAPKGMIYNYPKFYHSGSAILFFIRNSNGEMGIGKIAINHAQMATAKPLQQLGSVDTLLPLSRQLLAFPVVNNNKLYYSMVKPGKTDPYNLLMELDLSDCKQSRAPKELARSIRDIYQGYATKGKIIASLQTADGYGLFQMGENNIKNENPWAKKEGASKTEKTLQTNLQTDSLVEDQNEKKSNENFGVYFERQQVLDTIAKILRQDSDTKLIKGKMITRYFPVKKYPALSHPFHFHSLQPTADDPIYGLDLLGENILNTVQTSLSYRYNRVNEISSIGGDLSLGAWYIQPYVHMDYSWNYQAFTKDKQSFSFKELTSQLGLELPLSFSGGRWQRNLYLSTAISQSNLYFEDKGQEIHNALKQIRYLYSRAQFTFTSRQAALQLFPRLGINTYGELNTPLDDGPHQWMASTTFYLPGIFSTHSLRWNFSYQNRDTAGAYGYNSRFAFSRGYTRPSFATMWKFGADYDFPIWYPDFGFGGLVYFFRLRANIYYDQSYGFDNQKRRSSFASVGGALFTELNIGNQYPITIGLRYNHLLNKNFPTKNNFELILPIKLL